VRRGERNNRVNARPPPPPPPHRLRLSLPFRPSPSPHRTAPDSSAAPCQLCGAVAPLTPAAIVLCICFTTAEDLDPARTPPLPRLPFLSRAGPTTESTRLLPDAPASPCLHHRRAGPQASSTHAADNSRRISRRRCHESRGRPIDPPARAPALDLRIRSPAGRVKSSTFPLRFRPALMRESTR
jgi:hypothetical protein